MKLGKLEITVFTLVVAAIVWAFTTCSSQAALGESREMMEARFAEQPTTNGDGLYVYTDDLTHGVAVRYNDQNVVIAIMYMSFGAPFTDAERQLYDSYNLTLPHTPWVQRVNQDKLPGTNYKSVGNAWTSNIYEIEDGQSWRPELNTYVYIRMYRSLEAIKLTPEYGEHHLRP